MMDVVSFGKGGKAYLGLIRTLPTYGSAIFLLAMQLGMSGLYAKIQSFIFDITMLPVSAVQRGLYVMLDTAFYIKEGGMFNGIERYIELERRNNEMAQALVMRDREIMKLLAINKIVNADFGKKNIPFELCEVKFYMSGASKMLTCSIVGQNMGTIKRDSMVVSEKGLVGRVIRDYPEGSDRRDIKVQLITDYAFKIPIVTAESFVRGMAFGSNNNDIMELSYLDESSLVNKEIVVTASDAEIIMPEIFVGNIAINEDGRYVVKIKNRTKNLSFVKILL